MKRYLATMLSKITFVMGMVCSTVFAGDIADIKFEQNSSYTFSESQLMFNIQSRKGQVFDKKILDQDVKRLFSTGMFSDVTVNVEEDDIKDVVITFTVAPKALVSAVNISGNKKFSEEELRKEITIFAQNPQNDQHLRESVTNLRKFYKQKGYQDATVVSNLKPAADGSVTVNFEIKEHLKQKVNNVTFQGNTEFGNWRLKQIVETQYSFFSWLFDTGLFAKDELERDKQRLRDLYLQYGFLDFEVKDIIVTETDDDPEFVNVTFIVDEGLPYIVGNVTVTGNSSMESDILLSGLKVESNDAFNVKTARRDVTFMDRKYGSKGYADFRCEIVRTPDYATHMVDIEYKISEGSVYTVRNINITGNKVTKDYVIRREVKLQPGAVMDQTRLERDKSRIMNLRNYKSVDAVTVDAGQGKKDVNITVEESKTMHVKLGAGYSDMDDASVMLEVSETNFDISDPANYFRGGGQTARARAKFGRNSDNFSIDFTEPYMWDEPIGMNLKAYHTADYYSDWDEKRTGVAGSLSRRELMDEFNTLTLGLRFERVKISDVSNSLSPIFHEQEGSDQISAISLSFTRDTRDSRIEPTEGYYMNALTELNTEALGASDDFYRVELKGSKYYPLLDKSLILHTGIKAGIVDTFDSKRVPLYERYFMGGGDTVRGFERREISPVDYNEDPYGGKSMLLANIELMHPIYESVRGAFFTDAGSVGEEAGDIGFDDMNVGVGYGLRIKIPQLGAPLKLDMAYPVVTGRDHHDEKWRFHFDMGFDW